MSSKIRVAASSDARDESRHRRGMALDEERGCPLVARLPPCHKVEVGSRIGGLGDVGHAVQLVGRRAGPGVKADWL